MTKPKRKSGSTPNTKSSVEDPKDVEIAKKLLNIHQSALDRKLEFGLSFDSVKSLLKFPTCYYTGRRFERDGPFSRSIDRIDSAKGYVDGNVVSCTVDINGKKANLSDEEIELLYTKIVLNKKRHENLSPDTQLGLDQPRPRLNGLRINHQDELTSNKH